MRRATGGAISPRPGKAEQFRLDRERTVQRRLDASRTIVVLNPKGGAHKTTSTLLLAATFGTQRGGATLAWDNNETRGTLGWRAQKRAAPPHAVDLLEHLDQFTEPSQASLAALDTYVRTQVDARFDVLASDEDAAAPRSTRPRSTPPRCAVALLPPPDRRHGQQHARVELGRRRRGRRSARDRLDGARGHRRERRVAARRAAREGLRRGIDDAVTILAAPSAKPDRKLAERLERHFSQVTGDVVHVPFDPALVDGGPIDFDALSPESRDAWLTAAAAIAERL
ncbi:ParA family protein [Microbacterium aurum]|uniref:ParA family protein n=1 Tax=Microbacterium aurum TaxID=36805 RepID=UPI001E2F1418|nr:hypothetical protein [Microbacterium aurum]